MNSKTHVNLVLLTCHDYMFYASQDYGASARPIELIGNYALMYGLNRMVSEARRVISGNRPHYDEDLPKMEIYATPAVPATNKFFSTESGGSKKLDARPMIGASPTNFDSDPRTTEITWNSTGTSLLWTMPKEKINIPKTGSYHKILPLVTFYLYTVGGQIPGIFRIGKKHTPARLHCEPIEMNFEVGRFKATCPVNVADLPEETEIIEGSLVTIPPAPLLVEATLKGKYLKGVDGRGLIHRIPVPNQERFRGSWIIGS